MAEDTIVAARRLVKVTAGNLKHKHLYVRALLDILPPDCIGRTRKGKPIAIELTGLNQVIETDF